MVEQIDPGAFFRKGNSPLLKTLNRFARSSDAQRFNQEIVCSALRLGADLCLFVKGNFVNHRTVEKLRETGIATAVYYPDFHFEHPDVDKKMIQLVDLVCTTKSFQVNWLNKLRNGRPSIYIPHGYPPLVHGMFEPIIPEEDEYAHDIAYIGNPDPAKTQLLASVASSFPNKKILIAGNRWQRAAKGTSLEPFVLTGPLIGDFAAEAHRTSRINLAFHMGEKHGWSDYVSRRTFEIPASKGFMLHIDNHEVRSHYAVPEEIDTFANADDLCQKILRYLGDPRIRRTMIERAYMRAVPHYGHDTRGVEISAAVLAHPPFKPALRVVPSN